jgi:hypothetical protein
MASLLAVVGSVLLMMAQVEDCMLMSMTDEGENLGW